VYVFIEAHPRAEEALCDKDQSPRTGATDLAQLSGQLGYDPGRGAVGNSDRR
jgi:hypothetical protein